MTQFDQQWQRLVSAARQAPDAGDVGAPYGFASRIAARAIAVPALSPWGVFERFALRGLMVAAAFSVGSMAFHYSGVLSEPADVFAAPDTLVAVLDLS